MDEAVRWLADASCTSASLTRSLMTTGLGWCWTGTTAHRGPWLCIGIEATWHRGADQPNLARWVVAGQRQVRLLGADEFAVASRGAVDGHWAVESRHVLDYVAIAAQIGLWGVASFPFDREYPGTWLLTAAGWGSNAAAWTATVCSERGPERHLSAEDLVDQYRFAVDANRTATLV